MPLALQYDSKDAVPEDAQEDFVPFKDGDKEIYLHKDLAEARKQQFRLQGDLSEAQKKLEATSGKLSEYDKKMKEIEAKQAEAREKELEGGGQYKEIIDDLKRQKEELAKSKDEEIGKIRKQVQQKELNAVVAKVAAKAPEKSRKELERLAKYDFDFNDDGELVVLDLDGKATGQSLDDYMESLSQRYPTLVAAVQSQGGKGKGGHGGSDDNQKTVSRKDFDAMTQAERAKFFKAGGKVSD